MTRQDMIRDTVAKMAGKQGRPPGQQAFMDRACDIIIAFLNNNSVAPAFSESFTDS